MECRPWTLSEAQFRRREPEIKVDYGWWLEGLVDKVPSPSWTTFRVPIAFCEFSGLRVLGPRTRAIDTFLNFSRGLAKNKTLKSTTPVSTPQIRTQKVQLEVDSFEQQEVTPNLCNGKSNKDTQAWRSNS